MPSSISLVEPTRVEAGDQDHFVWQAIELRSARAAHSARAATRARERSAHSGKHARRRCLEAWSCLPLWRMAERSAGDFNLETGAGGDTGQTRPHEGPQPMGNGRSPHAVGTNFSALLGSLSGANG